jgi:glycerol kinase
MYARGILIGITRGTNKYHITRAALESIAYQTKDVVKTMAIDSGMELKCLRVDGGAAKNNFLMQFQSDILQIPIDRSQVNEITALGVSYLAGLGAGLYSGIKDIESLWKLETRFTPALNQATAEKLYSRWEMAVDRAKGWA